MDHTVVRELEYPDHVRLLHADMPALADEIAGWHGIENVLRWMAAQGLQRTAVDLVGQDEFSYDFLVQMEPAGRWLVFGVT